MKEIEFWHIPNVNFKLWNHLERCLGVFTRTEHTHQKSIPELCHIYTEDMYENVYSGTFVIVKSIAEWVNALLPPRLSFLLDSVWDLGSLCMLILTQNLPRWFLFDALFTTAWRSWYRAFVYGLFSAPSFQVPSRFANALDENGQGSHSPATLYTPFFHRGNQFSDFLHCRPLFVSFL